METGSHGRPRAHPRMGKDYSAEAEACHRDMDSVSERREALLSNTFRAYMRVLDRYEVLACQLTLQLGDHPPTSDVDRACRDLFADAFDALYIARRLVLRHYASTAFPLLRRAFEAICLIEYFANAPDRAEAWLRNREVKNVKIRKHLTSRGTEQGVDLKSSYDFLAKGAHLTRSMIPARLLGEGNRFVLGSIAPVSFTRPSEYVLELLRTWFWFMSTANLSFLRRSLPVNSTYWDEYMSTAEEAERAAKRLTQQMPRIAAADRAAIAQQRVTGVQRTSGRIRVGFPGFPAT